MASLRARPCVGFLAAESELRSLRALLARSDIETVIVHDQAGLLALADSHAVDAVAIIWEDGSAPALRLTDILRDSASTRFMPQMLLTTERSGHLVDYARMSAADVVLGVNEIVPVRRAIHDLIWNRRTYKDWSCLGWIAASHGLKKAASRGRMIPLSPISLEILCILLRDPAKTHTREDLAAQLCDAGAAQCNADSVTGHITALRRSFEVRGELLPLRTVSGEGYRLDLSQRAISDHLADTSRSRFFKKSSARNSKINYTVVEKFEAVG